MYKDVTLVTLKLLNVIVLSLAHDIDNKEDYILVMLKKDLFFIQSSK